MQGQGVVGSLEGSPVVAFFAAIQPRTGHELALMFVFMAVHTERELDLVTCFLARGNMAAGALHFRVWHNKRKTAFGVIRNRISTRYPAFYFMAALAPPAIGALQKLPAVRIRMVAIRTSGKRHWRLEIRTLMAGQARDSNVFSH
jgi:hypothetical protein